MRRLFVVSMFLILAIPTLLTAGGGDPSGYVREAVESYLAGRTPEGTEVELLRISPPPSFSLLDGGEKLEVLGPDRLAASGTMTLTLIVRQEGRVVKNLPLPVSIRIWERGVVAKRRLPKGKIVTKDDLEIGRVQRSPGRSTLVADAGDAVGKRLVKNVEVGEPLFVRDLERVVVVKPGQTVTIVAENELLRLTVPGQAKGSGAVGEMVVVRNLSSNRDVSARVVDEKTVRVEF